MADRERLAVWNMLDVDLGAVDAAFLATIASGGFEGLAVCRASFTKAVKRL